MRIEKIENFTKGWFIGDFEPSLNKSDFEVGIKKYKAGDKEERHYHKKSKEYTVIISGVVRMNENILNQGDIIEVNEFEDTDFECLEDAVTVVVKTKSVLGDKYLKN